MDTPVWDFVNKYAASGFVRLHMPGHKGKGRLGCEAYDITEVEGADALYEADGIIAESEKNASALFGTGRTVYSAEGSSQCIRAMVYLAVSLRKPAAAPVILAARNAHRSFVYACALCGADVVWLMPEERTASLISCRISADLLDRKLSSVNDNCCGVYVTTPDYLGQMQDITALSGVCRKHGIPLLADNAHGAYLHFLKEPLHPMDLGADICCDSAHKLLPVLTGGAYLHISEHAPAGYSARAKEAMALFGSTSPSYLILSSLDLNNRYLKERMKNDLADAACVVDLAKRRLKENGWEIQPSDPLRITVKCSGGKLAERLRENHIEPEYAGNDALVLLFSTVNAREYAEKLSDVLLSEQPSDYAPGTADEEFFLRQDGSGLKFHLPQRTMSIRDAVFSESEIIPSGLSAGRTAAFPAASCPPAVPVVMPGEIIGERESKLLIHYGYNNVSVVK